MRPVFLIVMGFSLLLIAFRLRGSVRGWSGWLTMTGAMMLTLGYSVLLPLYEAGVLAPLSQLGSLDRSVGPIVIGYVLKLVLMNGGWLLLGSGVALHANLFEKAPARVKAPATTTAAAPLHETAA